MKILGLHACFGSKNHSPGAAISVNGKIVSCCEEERYNRIKDSWGKLPNFSIRSALKLAKINIYQIDLVVSTGVTVKNFSKTIEKYFIEEFNYSPKILLVHHQLSHIASAFYSSGFKEATCISLDGFGDGKSGLIADLSLKKGIQKIKFIDKKDSLGRFYTLITEFLGYKTGDEYKVMGLAPYGKNNVDFSNVINFKNSNWKINSSYFIDRQSVYLNTYSKKFEKEFKKYKRSPNQKINQFHKNLAASAQAILTKSLLRGFNYAKNLSKYKNKICFAGGVALNCSAVKEIIYSKIFKEIYIPPNADDRGLIIGNAYLGSVYLKEKIKKLDNPFLGSSYTDKEILVELKNNNCKFYKTKNPSKVAANFLAKGKIIGWHQGRSEIGARALGNRSILANPQIKDMKNILNKKIKYREEFRPFAPSVLEEEAEKYFETLGHKIPFMNCIANAKKNNAAKIKSAVHVDGSSRVHTVNKKFNFEFYKLIKYFKDITGIPVVINTSFNLKGQPIVETPRDALMTFFGSGLDYLIIGSFVITKNKK